MQCVVEENSLGHKNCTKIFISIFSTITLYDIFLPNSIEKYQKMKKDM